MADYIDSAKATIDAQKMALLQAIAQGGQAARQTYQQGQSDIQAQQLATAQAALQRAAQLGAPAAASQGITETVSAPSNLHLQGLEGAANSRAAIFNSARQANSDFMNQSTAAIPALREVTQRRVEELKAQAAEKAAARQFAQQQHQWALEEHQANLEAAKAKQQSPSQILSSLGGADYVASAARQALDDGMRPGFSMDPQGGNLKSSEIDDKLGLPPGYTDFLLQQSAAKQSKKQPTSSDLEEQAARTAGVDLHAIKGLASFRDAVDTYEGAPEGATLAEIDAKVREGLIANYGHDYPQLRAYLRALYGS